MTQFNQSLNGETITEMYELPCLDSRQSFYGKATVLETASGRYLKSYDTIVCYLSNSGTFVKTWDGYSMTTMRHVNSFMIHCGLSYCGLSYCGKKWWDELETDAKYNACGMMKVLEEAI